MDEIISFFSIDPLLINCSAKKVIASLTISLSSFAPLIIIEFPLKYIVVWLVFLVL